MRGRMCLSVEGKCDYCGIVMEEGEGFTGMAAQYHTLEMKRA